MPIHHTLPSTAVHLRSYGGPFDEHRHDHAQLVLQLSGRLLMNIDGREGQLHLGQAAFVHPGLRHAQTGAGDNRALVIDLEAGGRSTAAGASAAAPSAAFAATSVDTTAHHASLPPALTPDLAARLAAQPYRTLPPAAQRLLDYMGLVLQAGPATATQAGHWVPLLLDALAAAPVRPASRLGVLTARVLASPGAPWSTERMARLVGLSVSRLHAVFREELGCTPAAWLADQRLQQVREALAGSDRPIAELALAAGYADQNALTRAMRRATGTTPAAWRRQAREAAQAAAVAAETAAAPAATVRA